MTHARLLVENCMLMRSARKQDPKKWRHSARHGELFGGLISDLLQLMKSACHEVEAKQSRTGLGVLHRPRASCLASNGGSCALPSDRFAVQQW